MRKLFIGIAAVALLALFALPVMADVEANPWDDCCDVQVLITIPQMAELWSNLGTAQERQSASPAGVKVTNAGGIIPAEGIAEDTLTHLSNIGVDVSVELSSSPNHIPEWTRFHVIVAPSNRGSYNCVFAWGGDAGATFSLGSISITNVNAANIITWDRRAGTTYVGNLPDTAYDAFSGSATTNSVGHLVDYAVDAIHGMPATGSMTPTVIWTIAPSG